MAKVPPDIDVLPEREARAHVITQARECLRSAHHAYVPAEVDEHAVAVAARALGFARWSELDRAMLEHEGRLAEAKALMDTAARRLRLVVPRRTKDEPTPEEVRGTKARARVALLDLLAYVAETQGTSEAEVLMGLGRSRLELGPEDEPRLRALIDGSAEGAL